MSVLIVVQLLAPVGLTWNSTLAASGPWTSASSWTVPDRFAPGFVSVTVGAVESTWTVTIELVRELPALSVATSWRS